MLTQLARGCRVQEAELTALTHYAGGALQQVSFRST